MKMASGQLPFQAAPSLIREKLAEKEMSQSEFAMRMGRSKKVISETINGLTSISATFAIHCERVLGIPMDALTSAQMHEALECARRTTNLDHILPYWFNRYHPPARRGPKPKPKTRSWAWSR